MTTQPHRADFDPHSPQTILWAALLHTIAARRMSAALDGAKLSITFQNTAEAQVFRNALLNRRHPWTMKP